jgi:hypothetical protein
MARAARAANLPFVLSTHSFVPVERVAFEAGGPPWYQLYMPTQREVAEAMLKRAFDAGCEVLVLTTDVPVGGNREYNDRNGFGMPLRIGRARGRRRAHASALAGRRLTPARCCCGRCPTGATGATGPVGTTWPGCAATGRASWW